MARRGSKKIATQHSVHMPRREPKTEPAPIKQRSAESDLAMRWLAVIEQAAVMPIPILRAAPPAEQLNQMLLHLGGTPQPDWLVAESFRVWAAMPAEQGLPDVSGALHALPKLRRALAIALLMTKCGQRYDERMQADRDAVAAGKIPPNHKPARITRVSAAETLTSITDEEIQDDE